jgi:hypothetical protein
MKTPCVSIRNASDWHDAGWEIRVGKVRLVWLVKKRRVSFSWGRRKGVTRLRKRSLIELDFDGWIILEPVNSRMHYLGGVAHLR